MNCDDYLSLLETLPVEDLVHGRAGEHAAGCQDCERVTRVVAERERYMLMAFDDIQHSAPAAQTAAKALTASRRRKVAIFYNIGLGVVTVAIIGSVMVSRIFPRNSTLILTETFRLQCLSPMQAAELVRPYIPAMGSIFIRDESLGVLNVSAPEAQMATVRSVLDRYDTPARAQCAVQVTVPHVP